MFTRSVAANTILDLSHKLAAQQQQYCHIWPHKIGAHQHYVHIIVHRIVLYNCIVHQIVLYNCIVHRIVLFIVSASPSRSGPSFQVWQSLPTDLASLSCH